MSKRQRPPILERAPLVTVQTYGVATILALIIITFIPWWIQCYLLYLGGVVFLVSLIAPFVEDLRPKSRVKVQGKAVFISGCDSGFGHMLAQRLDGLGLQVFAGCLFPEKEGAQILKNSCSERLRVVPLDVTSDESVQNSAKYVADNLGNNELLAVVNNAGIAAGVDMALTSMDTVKSIFKVNTFGVVRMTQAFLPLLCKGKGRIVTVASAAGRYSPPGMVAYSMSKYAVVSFCEGLRIEAYRFGVKIIIIEPWMYKTDITNKDSILDFNAKSWEEAPEEMKKLYPEDYVEKQKRLILNLFKLSISDRPQEVVDCMEEAILALDPKYVYSPGTLSCRLLFWFLKRLPKPIADRFVINALNTMMDTTLG